MTIISGRHLFAALSLSMVLAASTAGAQNQPLFPNAPMLQGEGLPQGEGLQGEGLQGGEQPPEDEVVPPEEEKAVERINNPVAEFAGIDKITGRIITFDVYIDETVQFGALQVTPRVCYSSPETDEPKTDSFVEVDEITLDRKIRRIFSGWMFAESPGLNAVEHAVYDVWLKSCKQSSEVPPPKSAEAGQ